MLRTIFIFSIILILSAFPAQSKKKRQADIYYLPHIHKVFNAKGYEAMGGDAVFFSYLFIALEILKNPKKYQLYVEGYYRDIYPGSKYRIHPRYLRRARRAFKKGFPKHIDHWTKKQKRIFVDYGPVVILYALRKVSRVKAADLWTSKKRLLRSFKRCAQGLRAVAKVTYAKEYSDWPSYYKDLGKAYNFDNNKKCNSIFSRREKYLVRRLKRHRKRSKKPLLILYGYAHDFGKYFNNEIKYIGTPSIEYASMCYSALNSSVLKVSPETYQACSVRFNGWLQGMGLAKYFSGSNTIPNTYSTIDNAIAGDRVVTENASRISKYEECLNSLTDTKTRLQGCTSLLDKKNKLTLSKKQTASVYFARGISHQMLKDYKKALEDYKTYLKYMPNDEDAHYRISLCHYYLKSHDQALKFVNIALKKNPKLARAYNLQGLIHQKKKQYSQSIDSFLLAIQNSKKYLTAYINLGRTHLLQENYDKAISVFEKTTKLKPTYAKGYYFLGLAYDRKKYSDKALKNYKEAVLLKEDYITAYINMGRIYGYKKDHTKALEYYLKTIKIKPDYALGHNNTAWSYYKLGKIELAFEHVQKSLKLNNKSGATFDTRAHVYEAMGEMDKALKDFEKSLELDPQNTISQAGLKRVKDKIKNL